MATISKSWAGESEILKTDAYGGTDDDLAADQQYDYSADIDLATSGYEGAHITIAYRGSNPKDDLIVDIFASLDGSIYDTEPYETWKLKNNGTPKQVSKIIKDLAHFRFGLKSSDTNTTFDYKIKLNAWNRDNS